MSKDNLKPAPFKSHSKVEIMRPIFILLVNSYVVSNGICTHTHPDRAALLMLY